MDPPGSSVAFLCDHMLGTLAKWLRILGFDTTYPEPTDDQTLRELARREGRVLLTRDRDLARSAGPPALFVASDVLDEQVVQVLTEKALSIDAPLTRCPICNALVETVPRAGVHGKVPDGVFSRHEQFWRCPECGRYYWQGTHWDQIWRRIETFRRRRAPPP